MFCRILAIEWLKLKRTREKLGILSSAKADARAKTSIQRSLQMKRSPEVRAFFR
jgi:hypothetical protein